MDIHEITLISAADMPQNYSKAEQELKYEDTYATMVDSEKKTNKNH